MGELTRRNSNVSLDEGFPEQIYLEAKHGKYATVSNGNIVFKLIQLAETPKQVTMHKIPRGNSVQMAFSFRRRDDTYLLAVEGNTVKLMKKESPYPFLKDKFLLQWEKKGGEWGILRSVAQPSMYLYIEGNVLTVRSNKSADNCHFRFRFLNNRGLSQCLCTTMSGGEMHWFEIGKHSPFL